MSNTDRTRPEAELTAEKDDPAALLEVAEAILEAVPRCFAITPGENGEVHARIVEPFARDPDWVVWVLTSNSSRKVAELRRSGHLTLAYQLDAEDAYLALVGQADVIQDAEEVGRRWRDGWRRYFSGGRDDPDLALVRFRADTIELYNTARQVQPHPAGLRTAILARSGLEWRIVQS